jgi:hypothetical protein
VVLEARARQARNRPGIPPRNEAVDGDDDFICAPVTVFSFPRSDDGSPLLPFTNLRFRWRKRRSAALLAVLASASKFTDLSDFEQARAAVKGDHQNPFPALTLKICPLISPNSGWPVSFAI